MLSSNPVLVPAPRPIVAPTVALATAPVQARLASDPAEFNPLRKFAVFFGLMYLIIKISYITEAVQFLTGIKLYLVPLTLTPAVLFVLASGGLARVFRLRPTILWILFVLWMAVCIPSSHWPGGSFDRVYGYIRYELAAILIPAGAFIVWKDMRRYCYAMAVAAFGVLFTAYFCSVMGQDGRLTLAFAGSIGNSNDLAAILLMLAPYLIYCIIDPKVFSFLRILCFGALGYSGYVILGSASRGAFLSVAAGFLFWLWKSSSRQRISALVLVPLLAIPVVVLLPSATFARIFSAVGEKHLEAEMSGDARSHLFWQSVRFTFEHPIFGVGPEQFTAYEAHISKQEGRRGAWHATHCSWTQVSSEEGLPALFFYATAIFSAGFLGLRVLRRARQLGNTEVANVAFCFLLSMVMYFTCITFLSNAYSSVQPMIISASIALYFIGNRALDETNKNERPVALPLGSFPVRSFA